MTQEKLGIGLVPYQHDQERIYDLVASIAEKFDLGFQTARGVSIPHLTLFQGVYTDADAVAQTLSTIDLTFLSAAEQVRGLSIWAQKIVFLDFEKSDRLSRAHEMVYRALRPLASGVSADPQNFQGITAGQQQSFASTGYPFSLDEYLPHVTLAHLKKNLKDADDAVVQLAQLLAHSGFPQEIQFEKLVAYRVGPLGACKEFVPELARD